MYNSDLSPFIILGILAVIVIVVLFVGIDNSEDPNYVEGKDCIMEVLEQSDDYKIYYDKSTSVTYFKTSTGVTPMYNSDGTIKLYVRDE